MFLPGSARIDEVEERSMCASEQSTLVCERVDYVPELGERESRGVLLLTTCRVGQPAGLKK